MNSSIQWIVLYIGAAVLIGILVIILVLIRIRERNEQKEREVWRFLPDRKAMGKLVLCCRSDQKKFQCMLKDRMVIGRSKEADVVLDFDRAVSERHCEIMKKGEEYYVRDLDSSNGTLYNQKPVIKENRISNGGILSLGHEEYELEIET